MSNNDPLVSIIVTSYNYEKFIGQTIQSILDQTYTNWELIISDDGSTDNSLAVIQTFKDERITLLSTRNNAGAGAAYNLAYGHCTGEYVCSIDSDDYMETDRLTKQVSYLREHPQVDVLGTFVREVDAAGQVTGDRYKHELWFNQELDLNRPDSWRWQNHLNRSSVLMRKTLHDRVGLTNNDLVYTPDYEFWARCLVEQAVFRVIPAKLTYYRYHGGNITHKDPTRQLLEMAYIFRAILWPCWNETNKPELIAESVSAFPFERLYNELDPPKRARLIGQLLSEQRPLSFPKFLADLQQEATRADILADSIAGGFHAAADAQRKYVEELQQSIKWLEAQRANWETEAMRATALLQEQRDWNAELERGKAAAEAQRDARQTEAVQTEQLLREQRDWITELEDAKAWLEAQRANWETEAMRATALLQEQRDWNTELERGKAAAETQKAAAEAQRDAREVEAAQTEKLLQEQRDWNAELERGKAAAEAQRDARQTEAAQTEQLLREQRDWITELEDAKAWLEAQRANWETEAMRATALLQEQRDWNVELERAKAWFEEQRDAWQLQAQQKEAHANQLKQELADLQQSHEQVVALASELEARTLAGRTRRIKSYFRSVDHPRQNKSQQENK